MLVVGCDGLKKRFSSQCTKAEKIKSYTDGLKEQLELLERSADGAALRYLFSLTDSSHPSPLMMRCAARQIRGAEGETEEVLHAAAAGDAEVGSAPREGHISHPCRN